MDEYLQYCQQDSEFYEHPGMSDDDNPFSVVAQNPGWTVERSTAWINYTPVAYKFAEQGWKIHVSVELEGASEALHQVAKYCFSENLPFKHLVSPKFHLQMNSKYARRGNSGKLVTIYPANEDELQKALAELTIALDGFRGPYILGDLRWKKGPLYVRYGGFLPFHCKTADGRTVLALRKPDGSLVPDVRGPVFNPPDWAPIPKFLAEEIEASKIEGNPLPYQIEKALHFSNAGGIFLARDPKRNTQVILREARPYAGLDGSGSDAVSRLYREAETLKSLGGLDFVPNLYETITAWEHHYLVEEFFDGETLATFMAKNNPIISGSPSPESIKKYTHDALDIISQISNALDELHSYGYVFADLHPQNIIVRPDKRIGLVDFEISFKPDEEPTPTLGCPGFVAAHAQSGTARDDYALDCLRLYLFMPLTMMADLDPASMDSLIDAASEYFELDEEYSAGLKSGLRFPSVNQTSRTSLRAKFEEAANAESDEASHILMTELAQSIKSTATPNRNDRLFPGDPQSLQGHGYNLAHGAAGVLFALKTANLVIDPEHVAWLYASIQRSTARSGLYDGFHGAALVLDGLGMTTEALEVIDRAAKSTADLASTSLFSGLTGVGLVMRHFARSTGDPHWQSELDSIALRVSELISLNGKRESDGEHKSPGLMRGKTGAALFFLRLYEDTLDTAFLDEARKALQIDLNEVHTTSGGEFLLRDKARSMPYLEIGSAGLLEAVELLHRYQPDEQLETIRDGIRLACNVTFTMEPGVFLGRAGLLLALSRAASNEHDRASLARHVQRLAWHAVHRPYGIAFPGRYLLRLSMDLATGNAGIILAMNGFTSVGSSRPPSTWLEASGLPIR